ncbi:class I SAM-dependent methyltransferase, partial [Patescibacteria group bacterium]|nr:class I SAM-dependent methyltransferase [Patescibacteria group bacterium]
DGIAVELGVAEGIFSRILLEGNPDFKILYSIDWWSGDRGHDENELETARKNLEPFGDRSQIIIKSFEDAREDFESDFFDFIYIDG